MGLRVAVLMGGWSVEREVSLTTGKSIIAALKKLQHIPIPIDVEKDLQKLVKDIHQAKPDVIFNAMHGVGGEDGVIQGVLNFLNIPYTHSGVTSSSLGMDKVLSRQIFKVNGLPVPDYKLIFHSELQQRNPFPFPYVIKPKYEGSSLGVYIIKNNQDRIHALENWLFNHHILVEEYIPGRDIFVPIINEKAAGIVEVKPHEGFYDYKAKYTSNQAIHLCPAPMPPHLYQEALEISEKAHNVIGCKGLTRVDFRYDDVSSPNRLILIEINTQPGLTPLSLVLDVASHIGMSFEDLIQTMVLSAQYG